MPAPTKVLRTHRPSLPAAISEPDYLVRECRSRKAKKRRIKNINDAIARAEVKLARPSRLDGKARFSIKSKRSMSRDTLQSCTACISSGLRPTGIWRKQRVTIIGGRKAGMTKYARRSGIEDPYQSPAISEVISTCWTGSTRTEAKVSARAGGRSSRSVSNAGTGNYDVMRSETRRYVRRATKIAQNVGRGVFPGAY